MYKYTRLVYSYLSQKTYWNTTKSCTDYSHFQYYHSLQYWSLTVPNWTIESAQNRISHQADWRVDKTSLLRSLHCLKSMARVVQGEGFAVPQYLNGVLSLLMTISRTSRGVVQAAEARRQLKMISLSSRFRPQPRHYATQHGGLLWFEISTLYRSWSRLSKNIKRQKAYMRYYLIIFYCTNTPFQLKTRILDFKKGPFVYSSSNRCHCSSIIFGKMLQIDKFYAQPTRSHQIPDVAIPERSNHRVLRFKKRGYEYINMKTALRKVGTSICHGNCMHQSEQRRRFQNRYHKS